MNTSKITDMSAYRQGSTATFANSQLTSGSGGGGGMDENIKMYIDSQVDVVRAQNDARFAEVITKIDNLPLKGWVQSITVVIALVGVLVAVLAFGGDQFSRGFQTNQEIGEVIEQLEAISRENTENINRNAEGIDLIIRNLSENR